MAHDVIVYGAYGHTGRFIVAELERRGFRPILSGRNEAKLRALSAVHPGADVRTADVEDPAALDQALAGASAIINCAGPFAATSGLLIEAALRAGIPYLDVAAEVEANLDTFERFDEPARDAGVTVLPAMAFYGGLGDLLATVAMDGASQADEICIAYGLTGWAPTAGTLAAGRVSRERRGGRRIVYARGGFQLVDGSPPAGKWQFPAPMGERPVVGEFTTADTVIFSKHFAAPEIRSFMSADAVAELINATGPSDRQASPAERFIVEVMVRRNGSERRVSASGRDIYATSAPLVVEAVERLLGSPGRNPGVRTAGQLFVARDFLAALSPQFLSVQLNEECPL